MKLAILTFGIFFLCLSFLSAQDTSSCSDIQKKYDDFTKETHFNTLVFQSPNIISDAIMYKYVLKEKSTYYLNLNTVGSTLEFSGKGVTVIFTDDTQWKRAEEIKMKPEGRTYHYRVLMELNKADLKLFSTKKIKKFRLYVFDEEVEDQQAVQFLSDVNCVIQAK